MLPRFLRPDHRWDPMSRPDENPTSSRRRVAAAAVAVLAALAVAGCGGGQEEPPPDPQAQVEREYSEQVRQAVAPLTTEGDDLFRQIREADSVKQLAGPLGDAEELYRATAARLEGITPPDDVAELHQQFVDAQERYADAVADAEKAVEDGDRRQLRDLVEAEKKYQERVGELQQEFSDSGLQF
jgi:hypothetical protein